MDKKVAKEKIEEILQIGEGNKEWMITAILNEMEQVFLRGKTAGLDWVSNNQKPLK